MVFGDMFYMYTCHLLCEYIVESFFPLYRWLVRQLLDTIQFELPSSFASSGTAFEMFALRDKVLMKRTSSQKSEA